MEWDATPKLNWLLKVTLHGDVDPDVECGIDPKM